ncbi:flap endonuclease 1 [Halalkalicoccus paucihalophilus]|uniref:Flap endonuclease 1 n=1 Tax=Halalkalicoccus paucihalophilus TaxID=1008153 RepID=A0A151AGW1_9EURY|nr:flap endonuclease-1 [Halalkalicoccus paucihalophilus]KYH26845.1 flap endonuclease 1 [Halalkalicoccus paucihalophilus]
MGNAALRDLAAIEPIRFEELSGSVVAIDAHNWLYRYLTTTVKWTASGIYTTEGGTEVANLMGIVQGLPKFFENDLVPVFVFDGVVTDLKEGEVSERRAAKERAAAKARAARDRGDGIEAARLEARTQRLTDAIQRTTRELLDLLDVPYVEAPAEGEAQAAHMAKAGDVDYAGTEDYDALLFGSPLTLRQLTSKGDPECMDLEATLAAHDLTYEQLVDVGILCGTDFNEGVHGMGPKTAVKAIHEHGDLLSVLDSRDAAIGSVEAVRELFLDPDVTDDYEFDTTLSPDIETAQEFVTDDWEIPAEEVARGFERIEESVTQTGLDQWT